MINNFGNLRKRQRFGQEPRAADGDTGAVSRNGWCVSYAPCPCFPCRPCPPPRCRIVYQTARSAVNPAPEPNPVPVPAYAYLYNNAAQTVDTAQPVAFGNNGALYGGIEHTPGSTAVTIAEAGTYGVWFSVTGTAANQFSLSLDGAPVPGTSYGSAAGATGPAIRILTPGFAVVTAAANSTLELVNETGSAVTLSVNAAGAVGVNASLLIVRLA